MRAPRCRIWSWSSPFGIKVGDRETRDIPDIFALPPDEVSRSRMARPCAGARSRRASATSGRAIARHQEAAALYLWEPYMHNPKLRRRLHRIDVPTLVLRGESDGLVSRGLCAGLLRGASRARAFDDAAPAPGHVPEYEQPAGLADRIVRFAA